MSELNEIKRYWPNGKLHIQFTMKDKCMHGIEKNWNDRGELWLERIWENGEIKKLTMWKDGALVDQINYADKEDGDK